MGESIDTTALIARARELADGPTVDNGVLVHPGTLRALAGAVESQAARLAAATDLLDKYEEFDRDPRNAYSRDLAALRIRSLRRALAAVTADEQGMT